LPTNIDNRRIVRIEQTIVETPTVKTLVFKDSLSHAAKPGQFLMIWIPRIEEIPMSVIKIFNRMTKDLKNYVEKKGMKNISEIIGIAHKY